MQTHFPPERLTDPTLRDAEQILRKCVHCGFCTATCPTYVLLGDELDSPRGRIYLIKEMLENDRPATQEVVRHIDRCLSCLACMTTCPSGVHYQHLIDHARVHVERTYRRPLRDRLVRHALAAVLPYPRRFAAALWLGRLIRPALGSRSGVLARIAELLPPTLSGRRNAAAPLGRNAPVSSGSPDFSDPAHELDLAPNRVEPQSVSSENGDSASHRESASNEKGGATGYDDTNFRAAVSRPRIAVLEGCVESVLAPNIHAAALRLLEKAGAEAVSVRGCCGAVVHHLGREKDNRRHAAPLIKRLHAELERGLDGVALTASGCGTHVKDYGHLFQNDPRLSAPAAEVAARARDISEILHTLGLPAATRPSGVEIAYHSACSMQHGQKVDAQPRALLEAAGFVVKEIPEGHLCCGSAGTYNLLQPEIADQLRDKKLACIEQTGAAIIATGNLGCIVQLASASPRPIVHTVELLDWATGGPRPAALADV